MPDAAEHSGDNPHVRYERHDVRPRTIAWMGIGTAALIAGAIVVVWLLGRHFDARESVAKASDQPLAAAQRDRRAGMPAEERLKEQFAGQPPLEGLPPQAPAHETGRWQAGSARYQIAEENEKLSGYGWVDEAKGIGRVPIERAARLALDQRDKYLRSRSKGGEQKNEGRSWWKVWEK